MKDFGESVSTWKGSGNLFSFNWFTANEPVALFFLSTGIARSDTLYLGWHTPPVHYFGFLNSIVMFLMFVIVL